MSDNIDFQNIWSQQQASPKPDIAALMQAAAKIKSRTRNKMILSSITLLLTALFICFIVVYYKPQMLTTKIGVVLVLIAIASLIVVSLSSIQALFQSNETENCSSYLRQLYDMKKKQEFLHQGMMTAYFVLLSSGILLYMIEYTMRMGPLGFVLSYGITIAWILFNWFYTRPRTIKKQQGQLNEMISKLEAVNEQLDN